MMNNILQTMLQQEQLEILRKHFKGFQQDFTDIQKKAILISLFDLANSDNELHKMELKYFHEVSALFGYSMEDNTIYRYLEMDRKYIEKVLTTLNEPQKDWYIISVIAMIYCDGKLHKKELSFIINYLSKIGISVNRFYDYLNKGKPLIIMKN